MLSRAFGQSASPDNLPRKVSDLFPWSGNISELGNAGREPGESYLFSLTAFNPGIRLTGDRVYGLQKYLMFEISCVRFLKEGSSS
jgi:hypothetical protein